MSQSPEVAENCLDPLLTTCIERNISVVLSVPSAGLYRHARSRLLVLDDSGIRLEAEQRLAILLQSLVGQRDQVQVSFMVRARRHWFSASVLAFDAHYALNSSTTLSTVSLSIPEQLQTDQRRASYRVAVTDDSEIKAKAWIISEQADFEAVPTSRTQIMFKSRDISDGGVGITLQAGGDDQRKFANDSRVRVELTADGTALVLEGRLRLFQPTEGVSSARGAIIFKDLGDDLQSRQKLTQLNKIIGDLQREEMRRNRRKTR